MLPIHVWNRKQAEELEPEPGHVMISISTPGPGKGCEPAKLREGWHDILRLEFGDCLPNEPGAERFLMTETQAKEVYDFAMRHSDRIIHVHCDAGFSRSVGCAIALVNLLDRQIKLHAIEHSGMANSHVSGLIHRIAWGDHFNGV